MILSLLVFVTVIMILFVFCYKTKIIYPLIIKFIGIIATFFSVLEYIVKLSVYSSKISYDYRLYLMLFNIKLNISTLALIGVFGISMLMVASLIFIYTWEKNRKIFFLLIPIVCFFALNATDFIEVIYLRTFDLGLTMNFAENIVNTIHMLGLAFLGWFIIFPYIFLSKSYRSSNVFKKKNDLLINGVIWFALDLSYILIVIVCKLSYYMFYMLDARKFPIKIVTPDENSMLFVAAVSIVVTIFVIAFVLRSMSSQSYLNSKKVVDLLQEKDEGVLMIMHTYKNAFASILMYSDKNEEYNFLGSERERLDAIKIIAQEQFEKIGRSMNACKTDKLIAVTLERVDLKQCVLQAIDRSYVDFAVRTKFCDEDVIIQGEKNHITESIVCVLNNAYDSMRNKNEDERYIEVVVGVDEPYYYIEVVDNGKGIEKNKIGAVFDVFYSTKKGGNNYGIGLSYVKKVTNAFDGDVEIRSKVGKGTTVQLFFFTGSLCKGDKKWKK